MQSTIFDTNRNQKSQYEYYRSKRRKCCLEEVIDLGFNFDEDMIIVLLVVLAALTLIDNKEIFSFFKAPVKATGEKTYIYRNPRQARQRRRLVY